MAKSKPAWTKSYFDAHTLEVQKLLADRLAGVKPIGAPPAGTDVFDGVVEIDSKLVAAECRPVIEKLMDAEFPLGLIQKGGYGSKDEAVDHLIKGLRDWCLDDTGSSAAATTG